jgi:hypothetical protein
VSLFIRVHNETLSVAVMWLREIETHEHKGDFKEF